MNEFDKNKARVKNLSIALAILEGSMTENSLKSDRHFQRRRGRKPFPPTLIERDRKLYEEWERARMNGITKGEFCLSKNIREIKDLDRALDRHRKREKRKR